MRSETPRSPAVEPLFLGSHPALDFLNTTYRAEGQAVEVIEDGEALLDWLVHAELLGKSAAAGLRRNLGAQRLDMLAGEARSMRTWATTWIHRWSLAPHADYGPELRRLNGLLHKGRHHWEVVAKDGRWQLLERSNVTSAEDLLAVIARQIASLVAAEDPALLRRCAGAECTLWFLDRTKSHRRMYCSASVCGNRAKVAAFRARQGSRE